MKFRIAQDATYTGRDRWQWSVWIEGLPRELAEIESVTYHLHPSFPSPVRVVKDRRSKFKLDATGWGTFTINAEIRLKDGPVLRRSHDLVLEYPEEPPEKGVAKKPTVFIAGSVADRPFVSALEEELEKAGIHTATDKDLDPGLPLPDSIERVLKSSDAAIVIVSDLTSPGVEWEARKAQSMHKPVVLIRVGKGRDLPEYLRDIKAIHLKETSDVSGLASKVATTLRSALGHQ
jgi:pYEATS domain-containing protein involved in immunity/TIR domain-containing protein